MKNLRNPILRSENAVNPAGMPLVELNEMELSEIHGAGPQSDNTSCGLICTWSSECQGRYTNSCCNY